jgi:thiol-disulfide isomerase/thioredoxin
MMIRTKLFVQIIVVGIIGSCLVLGCGISEGHDNPHVGNMNDFSYSGQWSDEACIYRVNELSGEVCVTDFEGQFMWTDDAAPWCRPCLAQAPIIRALESELGEQVVFLTNITSAKSEFQSIPTQQTAERWAQRFKLDRARVIAAQDRWGMTIPTHIPFSPTGQTLYRSKGFLSKEQIQAIMADCIRAWKNWSENGTVANWMKTG